jgi:hypothetical protein
MTLAFAGSAAWLAYGLSSGNPYLTVALPSSAFGYTLPKGVAGAQFGLGTLIPSLAISLVVTLLAGAFPSSTRGAK